MEDFIKLLSIYRQENRWAIVRKVFFNNIVSEKKLLWFWWLLVLVVVISSVFISESLIITVAIIPSIFGAISYRNGVYNESSDLIDSEEKKSLVREYGLNYEGLRYLQFEHSARNVGIDALDRAVKCLEIKEKTRVIKTFNNNWLIAGLISVLSIVMPLLIGTASQSVLLVIVVVLAIVILYSAMLLQVFVSEVDKVQEFKRFLLWLCETRKSS